MGEVRQRNKRFIYRTKIRWVNAKKGLLSSSSKPDIEIATPPEFRGHAGIWTPEDLFIASVNSCIMTTFLYYVEKENVEFLSYESEAEGILKRVENQLMFSHIMVWPKMVIALNAQKEKAEELMKRSENSCLISNSIKSKIEVIPEITIGEQNGGFQAG